MSEKRLRELISGDFHLPNCAIEQVGGHYWPDGKYVHCSCGIDKVLTDDPDVVKVLRLLTARAKRLRPSAERDTLDTVYWLVADTFHVRLIDEPPGWEWTEDMP